MTRLRSTAGVTGRRTAWLLVLAVVTAAGLAVDAYIHIHLAPIEPPAPAGHLGEGTLFYLEGAVAIAAAVVVLAFRRRWAFALAFVVAATALAAVLVTRYYDTGAVAFLPDMYEPVWYHDKVVATVAEAVATVTALLGVLTPFAGSSLRRSPRA